MQDVPVSSTTLGLLLSASIVLGQPASAARPAAPLTLSVSPAAMAPAVLARQTDQPKPSRSLDRGGATADPAWLQRYPAQNARSNDKWGRVLTDIIRHLPAKARYQDAFRRYIEAGDLITAGHEWTHFLNESLTLKTAVGVTAYYVLDDRYVTLPDPEGLRGIVPPVPASLRGNLYQLYLVQNAGNAKVDPLYLFDEWMAYINDVNVAVDQLEHNKPLNSESGALQPETAGNVVEFMFYGCAVGLAVKEHDPRYYRSEDGRRLREFIAWNIQRSMDIHARAVQHREVSRGDARNTALLSRFRNSADTAALRDWVRSDLGDAAARLLGVNQSVADANGG